MSYTLTVDGGVMRDDGAYVPADPENHDWQAYQAWLADGNAAAPYVAPPEPPQPLDFLAFLALFKGDEETAIFTARRTDVNVDKFITMAAGATRIDLGDVRVQQGVGYLVSAKLVTQARGDAVLAGTPPTA